MEHSRLNIFARASPTVLICIYMEVFPMRKKKASFIIKIWATRTSKNMGFLG